MRLYISIIIAFATFCFLGVMGEYNRSGEAKKWPTVDGIVVQTAKLPHNQFSDSDYQILYTYMVGKRTYSSETFRVLGATKQDFDRYRQRMPVTVHYNPQSPETSFVETDMNWQNVYKQLFALLVVIAVAVGLMIVRRKPAVKSE